ncbi:MAG TPA: sulfite exporter TauE/SafE family protein [Vicinamibacterales bacterium]|mgnify:CR=1 FL=1|nr:sulfite exporter TauE/SafE family protein [Vicinamibacterales bacterium]HPW22044.1 sulfite exporter TauE/SafE family protein [Vicinamibacterales bacterium]
MNRLLLLALFGAVAQAVDGSLGMGFGVTSTSLLLSLGVGSALASASVHMAELATSLVSGVSHFRVGNVERRLFWPLLVSGVAGAVAGTLAAVRFQDAPLIRVVVAGILLVLGVMIVVRFARRRQLRHAVPSRRRLALIGFPAAFIDALGGGGWGPIATPSLLMSRVEPAKAVGTVNAVEFFVTLTISSVFLAALPAIDWSVVAPLAAGAALAAPFAARATRRMPTRVLGTAVGALIILLSARTIALALLR